MESKGSTDIDRKLAIYYHPLFQEVIKSILSLFNTKGDKFEIGLLQFVEFNLKLQKALLPTFEIENALVSGLNDWVKEVAECLTYEGMVSTADCVEITPSNIRQVIERELTRSGIAMFAQGEAFLEQMVRASSHDAFKLLGVRINKEVFSKFMFDLCSTWCEFLDVELFAYFLIGLYMQISEGESLEHSNFRHTLSISTIDLEFMEEFEEIKSQYNRLRKKQLRYYRAWCEWNYLRVNEVGERLILKLDELHADDPRILQLAVVFENAIQIINEEITNQNPQRETDKQKEHLAREQRHSQAAEAGQDFLILKKLNIESGNATINQQSKENRDQQQPHAELLPVEDADAMAQDFEIEIDEEGNMYLKRIVKLPVLGTKIVPEPFHRKATLKRGLLERKKEEFRAVSNLYRKMDPLKVRLEHNTRIDPYAVRPSQKVQQRDQFYERQEHSPERRKKEFDRTIHQKPLHAEEPQSQQEIDVPLIKKEPKVSLRENKNYIHRVMAPPFLTDNENNLSYAEKEGQVYSTTANHEKRELKIGLPKLKHMEFRVKPVKSYHIVGRLINDRSVINERVRAASISLTEEEQQRTRLEIERQENRHIWSRYIDAEEMMQLTNYHDFYAKLETAKREFGNEFQSEFRSNLKPMLAYENKRYEMGGVLTKEEQQRFSERMARLIRKDDRRINRKKKKQKLREYRRNFKNKQEKTLFEDIFLKYHREAIRGIKQERALRHNSVVE